MSLWSLGTKIQKHSNLDQIAKVGEGPLACGLLRLPNGGGCQWACLFSNRGCGIQSLRFLWSSLLIADCGDVAINRLCFRTGI